MRFDPLRFKEKAWVTRLAPSPTGHLHLGHLLHLLYVTGISSQLGGKLILRLEDHDRQRSKKKFEVALLEDLEALKLDFGLTAVLKKGTSDFRQSDCGIHYQNAIQQLRTNGHHVYHCDCSRKKILARTNQEQGELRYDGFCRDRNLDPGPSTGLRLQLPEKAVQFDDGLTGSQVQNPQKTTGDLLLIDNHGNFTYQLCVVVDDLRHGVNLVIRGIDIMASTGRQMMLTEMITGEPAPFLYLHHPLITDETGRKLSKRDFDGDLHDKLATGISPQWLFGQALAKSGIIEHPRELELTEAQNLLLGI